MSTLRNQIDRGILLGGLTSMLILAPLSCVSDAGKLGNYVPRDDIGGLMLITVPLLAYGTVRALERAGWDFSNTRYLPKL